VQYETSLQEAKEMLTDPEMKDLAEEEILVAEKKIDELTEKLHLLLVPKDPNDPKNAIIEIRPGAGGEESSLFAGELMRAYFRFAEQEKLSVEIIDKNETEGGGIKECSFEVQGRDPTENSNLKEGFIAYSGSQKQSHRGECILLPFRWWCFPR
jgi:peptide chain release factor 1